MISIGAFEGAFSEWDPASVPAPAPIPGPAPPPTPLTWWEQYRRQLKHNSAVITETDAASQQVVDELDPTIHMPNGRLSVVGAVQSGKTASMIGVVAKAMDKGFQIIVVLAGSKNSLRNQTSQRFNKELLWLTEGNCWKKGQPYVWTNGRPTTTQSLFALDHYRYSYAPGAKTGCGFMPWHEDVTKVIPSLSAQAGDLANPSQGTRHLLCIVKKNPSSLRYLFKLLKRQFRGRKKDYSMLVIDDESDEITCPPTSVVNSGKLRPLASAALELSNGLFTSDGDYFRTHVVEYTATPQAPHAHPRTLNIKGVPAGTPNPFHSRKVIVLRTPADDLADTRLNYHNPVPYDGWYTGGSFFYDNDPSSTPPAPPKGMNAKHPMPSTPYGKGYPKPAPFFLPHQYSEYLKIPWPKRKTGKRASPPSLPPVFPYHEDDMTPRKGLESALISYLVSGTMRLCSQTGKTLSGTTDWPKPHAMLIHTERKKEQQWDFAKEVVGILEGLSGPNTVIPDSSPLNIDRTKFVTWALSKPIVRQMESWYKHYEIRYQEIVKDGATRGPIPSFADVLQKLPEVVRNVELKVINSDSDASKLQWDERVDEHGNGIKPQDVYSIVIGGDILGRGLTIPNLATTWFTRDSKKPLEDTVIQRQRWFGYRGSMWEYVTLHIPVYLYFELKSIHASDENARLSMYFHMINGTCPAANVFRVTQPRLKGSGKLGSAFEPCLKPHIFFSKVQFECFGAKEAEANEKLAGKIVKEIMKNPAKTENNLSGFVNTTDKKTALEVADYLDSIEFDDHGPVRNPKCKTAQVYHFFHACETAFSGVKILKKPKGKKKMATIQTWTQDPYLVAAYLRFWHHLSNTPSEMSNLVANGLITDTGGAPTVNPPPEFNLVFSGGSLNSIKNSTDPNIPPKSALVPNPITEAGLDIGEGRARTTWMGASTKAPGGNRYLDIPISDVTSSGRHYGDYRPSNWPGMFMIKIMETDGPDTSKIVNLPPSVAKHSDIAPNYAPIEFAISVPLGGPLLSYIGG